MKQILQGTNNLEVKIENKRRILRLLYVKEALAKQDIAAQLKLSLPTVTQNLKQLRDDGLTDESGNLESSGGRRPRLISFNKNARIAVGMEISRGYVRVVIINLRAELLAERKIDRGFSNTVEYWSALNSNINDLISACCIHKDIILGLGISFPGTVIVDRGMVEFAPTLELKNLNFEEVRKYFDIPVMIENEANAAGFAEVWGIEKLTDAVYLSITKGVGGSILIKDRIFRGDNGRSGEFGHMSLVHGGRQCSCGRRGCFEAYCSTNNLSKHTDGDLGGFFSQMRDGKREFRHIWDEYIDYLVTGILNIRMIFDADIILGGDIVEYLNVDFDHILEDIRKKNMYEDKAIFLKISRFGHNASAAGAALLQIDRFLKE